MIDLTVLKKRSVSVEDWEAVFTKPENRMPVFNPWAQSAPYLIAEDYGSDGRPKKELEGPGNFRNRMRMRIQEGREFNFQNYQLYKGMDDALDQPLRRAVTPTLLTRLMNREGTAEELTKELSAWGFNLQDVVLEVGDSKIPGKNIRKISAPAFFQIFVPLVKAYLTIRRAKIMNDLTQTPFFTYRPAFESAYTRLQCDALTSRVEVMSEQYGYWNTVDEAVFKLLHYGRAWQFPQEEWHSEEQEQADGTVKTTKEGLRYHFPHPTRVFWDQAHPARSFNTDTGCVYAGYWRVFRYREISANPLYYNRDRIYVGSYGWINMYNTFFQSVYPCVLQYPFPPANPSNDRETRLVDFVYTKDMNDKPVVLTEYFEKFVPAEYGLGEYKHPIWGRFVVAGDDTVVYAAPLPYSPVIYWHYDEDPARVDNASMSLEILPWQDHLTNLLTQYLITIKANLANVTFVDEDIVEKKWIDAIKNLGEKLFRQRNYLPFSGKRARAMQQTIPQAFFSHNFPALDSNGILQGMRMILDMTERVLQMSSQEVGAAASHEQTKAEIVQVGAQTSTRLNYTTIPVHQGRYAMMKQIYYALMAFSDDEFWVEVPAENTLTQEELEKLGFTYDPEKHPRKVSDKKIVMRAKKSAIMIERLAQIRESGDDKRGDSAIAMVLLQTLDRLLAGPLGPSIGPDQGIELVNLAGKLAGFPRDFKLSNMAPTMSPEQQAEAIKKQLAGFIGEIEARILGEVKQGLVPIMEHDKQQDQAIQHLTDIIEIAESHRPPAGMPPGAAGGTPPGILPPRPAVGPSTGPPPVPNGAPLPMQ